MKPPLASLRKDNVPVAAYIDDIFTLNSTKASCERNIQCIVHKLDTLGFVVHPQQSSFVPSMSLEYLGVIIDSLDMTVSLTMSKKQVIIGLCNEALVSGLSSIRFVAQLLGKFSSSFIAVPAGKLYFRDIERDKTLALKRQHGNFDKLMCLSLKAKTEITWWRDNVLISSAPIIRDNPSVVLKTDASLTGWGAICNGIRTGGLFTASEIQHINVLEMKAAFFGLQALCSYMSNVHIKILADNTSTVGAINNMGSSKSQSLHQVVKDTWEWALTRGLWLTATRIPGILNVEADEESRRCDTRTEWKLNESDFLLIVQELKFEPSIDLFASRTNTQLKRFASFRPDPEAEFIDAFSISWENLNLYAFPPFACVDRVLQK